MSEPSGRPMSATLFMQRLPDALRPHLPEPLKHFKWRARSWLSQIYYHQADFHYEVWLLRDGQRVELGLHFESRNRLHNQHLLAAFGSRLIEIKAELGDQVEVEAWDKGWSKVYETIPRQELTPDYLERVARRLARIISVLEPMLQEALQTLPTAVSQNARDNGHDMGDPLPKVG